MSTKTKPGKKVAVKNLNLVQLIKKMRPMLSGNVEKTAPNVYCIENIAELKFNYWCHWESKNPNMEKECFPHTITVRYVGEMWYSGSTPFRTRTFHKLVSGEFNYEAILVAITSCLNAEAAFKQKTKEQEERREKERNEKAEKQEQFYQRGKDSAPKSPLIKMDYQGYSIEPYLRFRCDPSYYKVDKANYSLYIQNLPPEVLSKIVEKALPIIEKQREKDLEKKQEQLKGENNGIE